MNANAAISNLRRWLPTALCALIALLPFFGILYFGLPSWFPGWVTTDVLSPAPENFWGAFPMRQLWYLAVAMVTVLLFPWRGWLGRWLSLAVLLAALAAAQAWIWQTGLSRPMMIGGLIPYSDAGVYTEYANHIVQVNQVRYSLQDRPMFSCLLASLLLFTGRNLQLAITLLLLFSGASLYLALRAVRASFGAVTAVVFGWAILMFYARWIGSTMTEHLGLTLGLLACPLLLTGLQQRRTSLWLGGLTLLTFALCARAGAFFVLPALVVFTGFHFCAKRRFAWLLSAKALALIIAVMAISRFLSFCVFNSETFPRSNFDYTAYGVVNQSSWELAFRKFGTNHDKIHKALVKHVKKHPASIPQGMWRAWETFFLTSYGFKFMDRNWELLLQSTVLFGFAFACWRRRPEDWFVIAVCIGVGASIPFAPPADADTMRVYAATIPLHALFAGLGIRAIFECLGRRPSFTREISNKDEGSVSTSFQASVVAGVLLCLAFVLPVIRFVYFPNQRPSETTKSIGKKPAQLPRGTYINLVADQAGTRFPDVQLSDFRKNLRGFAVTFPIEAAALAKLPAGVSIVTGGFDVAMFPTAKLHDPSSRAEFRRTVVGWMKIDADTELTLPFSNTPPKFPSE